MKQISVFFLFLLININVFSQNNNIEGNPFPENILKSIIYTTENDTIKLNDIILENKGKIIYVEFWASWCKPCIAEIPYANELTKKFENDEIVFIRFSTDEKNEDWIKALQKYELEGLNYRIEKESKSEIQDYLNIKGIPYIIILDKNGNIANKKAKYPSNSKAESEIINLLND